MKVEIGKQTIRLVPNDVKIAKKLIRHFLSKTKEEADKRGALTFYYTLVCVMYVMSADLIKSLSPEALALILNARADGYDQQKKAQQ